MIYMTFIPPPLSCSSDLIHNHLLSITRSASFLFLYCVQEWSHCRAFMLSVPPTWNVFPGIHVAYTQIAVFCSDITFIISTSLINLYKIITHKYPFSLPNPAYSFFASFFSFFLLFIMCLLTPKV